MLLAYDFGDLMWSFLVFFSWIIFFWLLFVVFGDLFSRHDVSGGGRQLAMPEHDLVDAEIRNHDDHHSSQRR